MKTSNSETDDILACSALLMFGDENQTKDNKKRRTTWVKDIFKERKIFGQFHTLYQEMRTADREISSHNRIFVLKVSKFFFVFEHTCFQTIDSL